MSNTTGLERPGAGQGRVVAGVCAAIADRFGVSRGLVRMLFVIFGLVGAGEIAYLVLWVMIPRAPGCHDHPPPHATRSKATVRQIGIPPRWPK